MTPISTAPRLGGLQRETMKANELLRVRELTTADVLQVGNDPTFFRVVSLEGSTSLPQSPWRVAVRSLDGTATATLVREGREQVLIVPRARSGS